MVEIRFHGRDDQGALASAELTAMAAMAQGKFAEAYPNSVCERRGVPVTACVRISDTPVRTRRKASSPSVVVVLDPTLLPSVDVTRDLKPEGLVIVNTRKTSAEIRGETGIRSRLAVVDASGGPLEITDIPITETATLGALIITPQAPVSEDCLAAADNLFHPLGEAGFTTSPCGFETAHALV